jgi:hypothetical protein
MQPEILRLLAASHIRDLLTEAGDARRTGEAHRARRCRRNRTPAQPGRSASVIPANPPQQWNRHLARRGTAAG